MLECVLVRFPVWQLFLPFWVACTSSSRSVPQQWLTVPQASRITDLCAKVQCVPHATEGVVIVDGKLVAGGKELTPRFASIQSFDVSLDRREIAFSAKRRGNFDIGLVSLDGSEIHWVPEDPADETEVQWAPRGNKVSYIVHTKVGDVVRTVHVPTAMQLSVDFPYSRIRALAWEPKAERYSVVITSPEASERIESMNYNGEARRVEVAPDTRLNVVTEPISGALMLRPPTLRYGERVPLVVWISEQPFEWNDARGMLIRIARVACAILPNAPDSAFWSAVNAIPWIDGTRVYVVFGGGQAILPVRTGGIACPPQSTKCIVPSDDSGYRIRGNQVLVPRAVVESFAAFWIAQQLKDSNAVR